MNKKLFLIVLIAIVVVVIIGFLFGFGGSDVDKNTVTGQSDSEKSLGGETALEGTIASQGTREYTNDNLDMLMDIFDSDSSYTDLQKGDLLKEYNGLWIKTSGTVHAIGSIVDTTRNPRDTVVTLKNPENQFLKGASVYFDESYKDELAKIGKGDDIRFEGRIDGYSNFYGIIIEDAEVL
jgi:hypothetical protein